MLVFTRCIHENASIYQVLLVFMKIDAGIYQVLVFIKVMLVFIKYWLNADIYNTHEVHRKGCQWCNIYCSISWI